MRKAFSIVTAIFVIIVMALISELVFNLSGKMTKATSIQYRQEQAALLARSYTELAILSVINHQRNTANKCIQNINGAVNSIIPGTAPAAGVSTNNGAGYLVQTRIYYLGNDLDKSNISNSRWLNRTMPIVTDYNTTTPPLPDSVAAIIVDVYVKYKDPAMVEAYKSAHSGAAPTSKQIPWITYHRKTLQKI